MIYGLEPPALLCHFKPWTCISMCLGTGDSFPAEIVLAKGRMKIIRNFQAVSKFYVCVYQCKIPAA